jgi:hypothetical protein
LLLVLAILTSAALPVGACEKLNGKLIEQECTCANFASVLLNQITDCEACHRHGCKQTVSDSDAALLSDFDTTIGTPVISGSVPVTVLGVQVICTELRAIFAARPPPQSLLAHLSTIRLLI